MRRIAAKRQEKIYQKSVLGVQETSPSCRGKDILIGIPFSDQIETLPEVIKTAQQGLQQYLSDKSAAFVIAATHEGKNFLQQITAVFKELAIAGQCFILARELQGKGWAIRALMELSASFGSDLLLIEPDFVRQGQQGIQPSWISSLYRPLALATCIGHGLCAPGVRQTS